MAYSKAVTSGELIMAAGTRADMLRLSTGERIGGLWSWRDPAERLSDLREMRAILKANGMHMVQGTPVLMARSIYGVRKAWIIKDGLAAQG